MHERYQLLQLIFGSKFIPYSTYLKILNKVTIHVLPHLKRMRLVSMRSSHVPFKMHYRLVSVRSSLPFINISVRIEPTKLKANRKREVCEVSFLAACPSPMPLIFFIGLLQPWREQHQACGDL